MNDAFLVSKPQIPCSLNAAPSAEEVSLRHGVIEHWRFEYPLQRLLKWRRATWADLSVLLPDLPAGLYQTLNDDRWN